MDKESAEAMASRLLKAFFDAPAVEPGESARIQAKVPSADLSPKETGILGVDVPPAS